MSASLVTDAGMETDLIFHHGVELTDFAAFPLLDSTAGRDVLTRYYDDFAAIAERAGAGLMLEGPTWRANPDWGTRLGYPAPELTRVNMASIERLHQLRERYAARVGPIVVSGTIGPRGDGYSADTRLSPQDAAEYHRPQLDAFAAAGADRATAYTLTHVGEATGIVQAARAAGMPVAISFTVETDGRLPSGDTVAEAIDAVDAEAPPDHFLINCAHPSHILRGLDDPGLRTERITGIRVNASSRSHAELDASDELDEGDVDEVAASCRALVAMLPSLSILGGCCGTDHRHVAALWGV